VDFFPSLFYVSILHPNKAIDHCRVFLDGVPLPWWNSPRSRPNYDLKIGVNGGGNVRIPEASRTNSTFLIVKNGRTTLRKERFNDIPNVR
jgi:hypothetical protein